MARDWAEHQVAVSVDWSPTSRLAALLSGGANAHVAHHLFPAYSHCHAVVLRHLVAEVAEAHGLELHAADFTGMLHGHVRHVRAMGGRRNAASGALAAGVADSKAKQLCFETKNFCL